MSQTPEENKPKPDNSPGGQLKNIAEAINTGATVVANNNGNRMYIFILFVLLGLVGWHDYTQWGRDDTKQVKVDAGTTIIMKMKDDRHTEDTAKISSLEKKIDKVEEDKRLLVIENKEKEAANGQALVKIDRLTNLLQIERNRKK